MQSRREKTLTLEARLQQYSPVHQLSSQQNQLNFLQQRLQQRMQNLIEQLQQKIISLAREMDAFSPLATLGRGYSLVKNEQDELVKSADQLQKDQHVTVFFADSQALMTVDKLLGKSL